ncbi:MAG: S8 family serine peptidase [bacterium]|nr:S8 family serine peptidase [bacterium]
MMVRRGVGVVLGAALALTLGIAPAHASPTPVEPDPGVEATPGTPRWFLQMGSQATALGGSQGRIEAEHSAFEREAAAAGLEPAITARHTTLFNGLVVAAEEDAATELAALPSVQALFPVVGVQAPEVRAVATEVAPALEMMGAGRAHTDLGLSGAGVRVGIIDSGVDYHHPDLGGSADSEFPTERVAFGQDFVGDSFASFAPAPTAATPAPDPDPDDCLGHGTHVAGIIGANGEFTGVAPGATLGSYRVFGCTGSTTSDILLGAMEAAFADGMDVLTLPTPPVHEGSSYPTTAAADALSQAGVVVVAPAGNGAVGDERRGAAVEGGGPISVASFENNLLVQSALIASHGEEITIGYLDATGAPPLSSDLDGTEIVLADPAIACEPLEEDLGGRVLVTKRGTCSFHVKAINAQQAGASAVVVTNDSDSPLYMTVAGEPAVTIPAISLTRSDGAAILRLTEGGDADDTATITVPGSTITMTDPAGGLISDFSPLGNASQVPDLGAPGGAIPSTYPLERGGSATLSGVTLAAASVAGAAALALEGSPELTPGEVLAQLQNTATPAPTAVAPGSGIQETPLHQGAGLIRVDAALEGTTSVLPGLVNAGPSAEGPYSAPLTIANMSGSDETYRFSYVPALGIPAAGLGEAVTASTFDADITFSEADLPVPAGAQREVTVTVSPSADAPTGAMYSGFLVVSDRGGDVVATVPYTGLVGASNARASRPGW